MNNSELDNVKKIELEIALELKRVCDKYNIDYFLDAGTFLGAVRHKGFIPWDDDIDIGFSRENYEKFINVAKKDLKKDFFLQTWNTDESYPNAYGKIRKLGTVFLEEGANPNSPHNEIYIDLFPYDNYPDKKFEQLFASLKIRALQKTLFLKCGYKPWNNFTGVKRHYLYLRYLPFVLICPFVTKTGLKFRYGKLMRKLNKKESNYCFEQEGGYTYKIPKQLMNDLDQYEFEKHLFKGLRDYNSFLKVFYGDYMKLPNPEERISHHKVITIKT